MNRRTALQHVIVLGAGATLLASCQDKATIATKNIPLTGSQEKLLSALAETIIPSSDFVGAKELQAHQFIVVMADDCASAEEQNKFVAGMKAFDDFAKQKIQTSFAKATAEQRTTLLSALEAKTDVPENVVEFYQTIKQLTIQSFTTSEAFLTQVRNFSLIPPKFQGCVSV
jgi:hypothetical protein